MNDQKEYEKELRDHFVTGVRSCAVMDECIALRDHLAAVVMRELIQKPGFCHIPAKDLAPTLATDAYSIADAMIEARNKK